MRKPTLATAAYIAPFAVFFAIYLPVAGHGFISDDFSWILHNRLRGRRRVLVAAILVPALLFPVYRGRTGRWVTIAEFSTRTLADLQQLAAGLPNDSQIVVVDDRSKRANMASAFGWLLRDAYLLTTDRFIDFWIEPPMYEADVGYRPCDTCVDLWLAVRDGHLVAVSPQKIRRSGGSHKTKEFRSFFTEDEGDQETLSPVKRLLNSFVSCKSS
jgi:hypothetical protein